MDHYHLDLAVRRAVSPIGAADADATVRAWVEFRARGPTGGGDALLQHQPLSNQGIECCDRGADRCCFLIETGGTCVSSGGKPFTAC